jgi:hypothetical protein
VSAAERDAKARRVRIFSSFSDRAFDYMAGVVSVPCLIILFVVTSSRALIHGFVFEFVIERGAVSRAKQTEAHGPKSSDDHKCGSIMYYSEFDMPSFFSTKPHLRYHFTNVSALSLEVSSPHAGDCLTLQ